LGNLVSAARDGLTEIESQINESLAVYTSEESKQKEFESGEEEDDQRSAAQSSDGWEKCSEPDENVEGMQKGAPGMSFVDLKSAVDDITSTEQSEPKVTTDLATALKTIESMGKQIQNLKEKLSESQKEAQKYREENFELRQQLGADLQQGE